MTRVRVVLCDWSSRGSQWVGPTRSISFSASLGHVAPCRRSRSTEEATVAGVEFRLADPLSPDRTNGAIAAQAHAAGLA